MQHEMEKQIMVQKQTGHYNQILVVHKTISSHPASVS